MLRELILLRFLAILLITNSHFDRFYPVALLGTGGSLGNSIFFLISSIGLTISLNKHKVNFRKWIIKRFVRIYPIVWLVTTIFVLIGFFQINNIHDFFVLYVWPTRFWFFSTIMLLYFPIYFVIIAYTPKRILLVLLISIFVYIFCYTTILNLNLPTIVESGYMRILYSFIVMLFGVFIANNYKYINNNNSLDRLILFVITVLYFSLKLVILKLSLYNFQFLVQVLTIPWLFYLLKVIVHSGFILRLMKRRIMYILITKIAASSLEIYLLQAYIISLVLHFTIFPFNIILFTLITIPSAYFLHIVYENIVAHLSGIRYKL